MSGSFYHMTKSSELNLKSNGPKHTHSAMFCNFYVSAIYDVMKYYSTRVLAKKIRNGYITWEARVVIR